MTPTVAGFRDKADIYWLNWSSGSHNFTTISALSSYTPKLTVPFLNFPTPGGLSEWVIGQGRFSAHREFRICTCVDIVEELGLCPLTWS